MAFLSPIVIVVVWWFGWVPRNARRICNAKLFKKDLFFEANDAGQIEVHYGTVEGPGMFSSGKTKIAFMPLSAESWVNKVFSFNRMRCLFGYTGKGAAVNVETLAVMQANLDLEVARLQSASKEVDAETAKKEALKKWLENSPDDVKPHVAGLIQSLTSKYTNVEETTNEKNPKEPARKMAVLLDPRNLKYFISKALSPTQIQYMQKKAYLKGLNDAEKGFLSKALPLILIVVGVVGVIAFFLMK